MIICMMSTDCNEYYAGVGIHKSGYEGWFLVKRHNKNDPQGGVNIFVENGSHVENIQRGMMSANPHLRYICLRYDEMENLPFEIKSEIEKLILKQNSRRGI